MEVQKNVRYSSINSESDENSYKKLNENKKDIMDNLKLDLKIEEKLKKIISKDKKSEK